jgi:plasmid stabilization system protein ParE
VKILWTKAAQSSFDNIVDYLKNKWSINSAIKFVNKTIVFLDILQKHPEIGKKENIKNDLRSFVLTRQTTIFYRIKNDTTIVLLKFFDTRQNPEKRIK